MTIAVLMTVHNRKYHTIKSLDSLFSQQSNMYYDLHVYLTDDGSVDGTSLAISLKYPNVNIIAGDGFLYWNRGMHKAWQAALYSKGYDFYLWLNDDTILTPDAVFSLLSASIQMDNKSIIVGTTSSSNDKKIITYGGRNNKGKLIEPKENLIPCTYFNGNIVLIPHYVYQINGTNDILFHHALGDFDYGLRASKLGINSYVANSILGTCDLHENLPIWCDKSHSFFKRWKAFRTPLGQNPEEFFIFDKRHNGLISAIYHYFTIHLRVIFPQIWKA